MHTSISWRNPFTFLSLLFVLLLGSYVCSTAFADDERFTIRAGRTSASEHASSLRLLTGYNADAEGCGDVMLGPLPEGQYTGEEAWLKLIEPVCPVVYSKVGPSDRRKASVDPSKCPCGFGLPRVTRLREEHVLVTRSALPMLDEYIPSHVQVLDRKRIDESGASSVPDLLRYISQAAFHRGRGDRLSGAQYAELRGLGAAYTLVLLNGRRAFGTATDLAASAFDLSSIPLSAVQRVEVSLDANSLVHGMDAIGGIVNVVLKKHAEPGAEVRYDFTQDAGSQSRASINGGIRGERGQLAVYVDLQRSNQLLGHERERWRDQDYQPLGGLDYRLPIASPANVSSTNGEDLPGLDAPFAAGRVNPETGMLEFVSGERNATSIRAFQAVVPDARRTSLWANGSMRIGRSVASMELLAFERENELQIGPSLIPGYQMSAGHPDNPFDVPVRVDALLAGLPMQRYLVESDLRRGVAAIEGPLGDWEYSAFAVRSDEKARSKLRNVTNPLAIAGALQPVGQSPSLSLRRTFEVGDVPQGILIDAPFDRDRGSATHLQVSAKGPVLRLPGGDLIANVGIEHRHESVDFDARVADASRDVASAFLHLRVPLIQRSMNIPVVEDMQLLLGARRDDYSDIGGITKTQLGLDWRITESVKLQASTSESFRPPSLVDLYFPRMIVPTVIFDPKQAKAGPVEFLTGGNPALHSTTGRSRSVGVSFESGALRLSADYWRVKVRDYVSLVAPMALLAHEDVALAGRITREDSTGRLLLLDISRANVGGAVTEGVDLAAQIAIDTRIGSFMPRLSVTLSDEFQYSELPITQGPMEDRVGVASESGTIPAQRGVASLTYEHNDWRVSVHARVISSYWDRSVITGAPMQRRVPGGETWDFNVSKQIAGNLRFTLGAFNVQDREPPYAHVGGSLGFDDSQGDLEGRTIFGILNGRF